jgi:hypothetical protein
MVSQPIMSKQDKEWMAQDDAHALARAEEIKKDPNRVKMAATAAAKMQKESQQRADAMKKVAQNAPTKSVQKRVQTQSKSTGRKK